MIDYFFRWTDEAAARADAIAAAQHFGIQGPGGWQWFRDHVLPDVKVWRPTQDVGGTHTYLSGWSAIVSLDQQVQMLLNATALAFAMNRDGPPYVIKNNIGVIITDIACAPIFAGSHYPIGGYS